MSKVFEIKDEFYLDGKEVKIVSGALHYFRVVPEYWEDRLEKLKAMGCNTVETYVPWNLHEPHEEAFKFEGLLNIKRFIEIAQEVGLWVIVRPSPYICAEWEYGGLPGWLLKYDDMKIRCNYQPFLDKVDRYFDRLFKEIIPLQINEGGPIIMMQVENEYGGYGNDKVYLEKLAHMMRKHGATVPFVTSDGPWGDMLENGSIPEYAHPTVNCGSDLKNQLQTLQKFNKRKGPLMVMEYWIGWFDAWGDPEHHTRDTQSAAKELDDALSIGHINFYMFHGGTNFGFTNGANYYDRLTPDTTSYDYDAPLSEWGDVTEKYKAFQAVIKKHLPAAETSIPKNAKKIHYGKLTVQQKTSLFSTLESLAEPVRTDYTIPMEKLDQNFGYILYRSNIGKKRNIEDFRLVGANDRAQVYVNQEHLFTQYDLELGNKESFELNNDENTLDILVENLGRVNYSIKMGYQQKGIKDGVIVNGAFQSVWDEYTLPLDNIDTIDFDTQYKANTPSFYQFKVEVAEMGDTFIDMTGWGKGVVFVNGFNLGRFWEIGPQTKLYLPAPLLKAGSNEIIVFETEGKAQEHIVLTNEPPFIA
ncbi:glycoside hydrolase family 35 protein [Desemzia sp. FAM 24101]|uniref:glycoside hydrolase family 35 protein n=1 Tax=unclassified Desemzia TaxID=2685243 RepID=UPI00388A81B1